MNLSRRKFITGAALLVASPAIVRAESLMRIYPLRRDYTFSVYVKSLSSAFDMRLEEQRKNLMTIKDVGNDWHRIEYLLKNLTQKEAHHHIQLPAGIYWGGQLQEDT